MQWRSIGVFQLFDHMVILMCPMMTELLGLDSYASDAAPAEA